jgi:hypothetical protein
MGQYKLGRLVGWLVGALYCEGARLDGSKDSHVGDIDAEDLDSEHLSKR